MPVAPELGLGRHGVGKGELQTQEDYWLFLAANILVRQQAAGLVRENKVESDGGEDSMSFLVCMCVNLHTCKPQTGRQTHAHMHTHIHTHTRLRFVYTMLSTFMTLCKHRTLACYLT